MARVICGEGMPDFYAKEIINSEHMYCIGKNTDYFLGPLFRHLGFCKSIDDYHFKKDKNGDPLISEC